MEEVVVGKTCPYCQSPIKDEENIIVCTKCKTPHHKECWDENKECTTFGCDEKRGALTSEVVINSAGSVDLTKKNCPYCAEEILIDAIKCKHCQSLLEELASVREVDAVQENPTQEMNSLELQYAGFWKRAVAAIIDGTIMFVIVYILEIILFGYYTDLLWPSILVFWLYHGILESSKKQATLGKMFLRIKVIDKDGNRLSFPKASARYFAMFFSSIILGIGFIMAGFTEKKQALHDIIAGCLVVNS